MDLSIIIPNWNTKSLLENCLNSLFNTPINYEFEVWVVDNASTDDSLKDLPALFPQVRLIKNLENVGYGRANNQAAKVAQGTYWLLLNSDTVVFPAAINDLVEYLDAHPQAAAVGPRLLNADGTLQVSASPAPTLGRELWRLFHLDQFYPLSQYPEEFFKGGDPKIVDVLLGACLLIRAEVNQKIGLFDEDYFMYSEEVDLCERIRKSGAEIHWFGKPVVTHFGGMSTRQASEKMFLELYRSKIKFFRKNYGAFQTNLYKFILWMAAQARIISCKLIGLFSVENRNRWSATIKNYQALLNILSGL
jgi:GT2 family glycosyltransferase